MKGMLAKMGCVARFPPQLLRHIFVEERMGEERVDGPSDQGAAMVMGHSTRMWRAHYDTQHHKREMQKSVDAMEEWREGLGVCDKLSTSEEEWEEEWEEEEKGGEEGEGEEGEEEGEGEEWFECNETMEL